MNLRYKLAALGAAALMMLGMSGAAMAADDTTNHTFTITAGSEFSIDAFQNSNFGTVAFSLTNPQQWNVNSASFDYKVTDLRGNGKGWTVNAASPGFFNTVGNVAVTGEDLTATNNTPWATNLPGGLTPSGDGRFRWATGAVGTSAVSTTNSGSILGSGRTLMQAADGTPGNIPNGTGEFYDENALFLYFPPAIAAGTYTATVTLTLTSVLP
jgi:hypothetical protein